MNSVLKSVYTVSIPVSVKFTGTDRMDSEPNLSVKRSITIGTMVNFDGEFDGHGHGDGTCEQTFTEHAAFILTGTLGIRTTG